MSRLFSMNIGDRVKSEREKRGWSQTELAKRAGITQGAVSQLERGISSSTRYIKDIADAFKMPIDYLINDEIRIKSQLPQLTDFVIAGVKDTHPIADEYSIVPRYSVKAGCGDSVALADVRIIGGLAFQNSWLKKHNLPEAHYLITAESQGMSMYPTISPGTVLLANSLDVIPKSGKVYLICINEELVAKRLIQDMDGFWVIRSDNENKIEYPDIKITEDKIHEIKIEGRVVWQGGMM